MNLESLRDVWMKNNTCLVHGNNQYTLSIKWINVLHLKVCLLIKTLPASGERVSEVLTYSLKVLPNIVALCGLDLHQQKTSRLKTADNAEK